jgi:hypothetical protein
MSKKYLSVSAPVVTQEISVATPLATDKKP